MKPHKHAELLMQYAQDAAKIDNPWVLYQTEVDKGEWKPLGVSDGFSLHYKYRRKPNADELLAEMLKPKLTPVDMSVLVGSGLDCQFGSEYIEGKTYSHLASTSGDGCYYGENGETYYFCKPRMNHWISCNGFADAGLEMCDALKEAGFRVRKSGGSFKITGLKQGYCWPWESNNG